MSHRDAAAPSLEPAGAADAAAVVRLRDAAASWLLGRGTEVGRHAFTPDSPWPPVLLVEKALR